MNEKEFGITQEWLLERFRYDDGKLIKTTKASKTIQGFWEWAINGNNYRRITVYNQGLRKNCKVHRLIWIMHNGDIPDGFVIDHINRDTLDNRIENLRCCSQRENSMNNCKNTTGYPGVSYVKKTKTWYVQLWGVQNGVGKMIFFKHYKTIEEAVQARREAEFRYGLEVREEFHVAI